MAVGIELQFRGATLAQYDQVIQRMGFKPGGPGARGSLFHCAAKTEDGFRVIDVWESREQFERFSRDKIAPYTADAGMPEPPQITFFDVHNYLTKG
jgi:hypothetical protein